jgi:hypothetical protein
MELTKTVYPFYGLNEYIRIYDLFIFLLSDRFPFVPCFGFEHVSNIRSAFIVLIEYVKAFDFQGKSVTVCSASRTSTQFFVSLLTI